MKKTTILSLPLNRADEAVAFVENLFPYEPPENIQLAVASSVDTRLQAERLRKWDCPWSTYWIA